MEGEESGQMVLASDLIKITETCILAFHLFLKKDKGKSSSALNLFGNQNQGATPLQQIQSSLEKVRFHLTFTLKYFTKFSLKFRLIDIAIDNDKIIMQLY